LMQDIADPVALTCPDCAGVLSVVTAGKPLRFRCQVGHAYTAAVLARKQSAGVDEALQVALRIVEERAELVSRMADEGRASGRVAVAQMYAARADEYRRHAQVIRRTLLESFGNEVQET
jgi:two-component system chemotaxis response regulator CheB